MVASGEEALVVAHHELAVDLLHRLERDTHGDQQRGAAEGELADVPQLEDEERTRAMIIRKIAPGSVIRFSTLARYFSVGGPGGCPG
jgi:hypothetical protein